MSPSSAWLIRDKYSLYATFLCALRILQRKFVRGIKAACKVKTGKIWVQKITGVYCMGRGAHGGRMFLLVRCCEEELVFRPATCYTLWRCVFV